MTARSALDLPVGEDWDRWFAEAEHRLARSADAALESLEALAVAHPAAPASELVVRIDDVHAALHGWGGLASTVARAHPRADARRRAGLALPQVAERADRLYLSSALHRAVVGAIPSATGIERRALELELVELDRRGAGKSAGDIDVLADLAREEAALGLAFEQNLLEDADVPTPMEALDDLPESLLADLAVVGDTALVPLAPHRLSTVLAHLRDRSLREHLHGLADRRGAANRGVLTDLVEVRRRRARLVGRGSSAEEQLVGQMLDHVDEVTAFLDRLSEGIGPSVAEESAHLLHRLRRDVPEAGHVSRADLIHYDAVDRSRATGPDDPATGPGADEWMDWLLAECARVLDLTWQPCDVASWAPGVRVLDCVDRRGAVVGRAHLDLSPRPGKFERPVHMALQPGGGGRLPEGALLCSFGSALTSQDQRVLAHEFGHLLHHLRGSGHDLVALNGISPEVDFGEAVADVVERCFAELPGGHGRGAAGSHYPALELARQTHLAALSLHLHTGLDVEQAQYRARHHSPWPTAVDQAATFGHLVTMGATYYTYVWSRALVEHLSEVLFTGATGPESALARLDSLVLCQGAARSAADLVAELTGARPDPIELADSLAGTVSRLSPCPSWSRRLRLMCSTPASTQPTAPNCSTCCIHSWSGERSHISVTTEPPALRRSRPVIAMAKHGMSSSSSSTASATQTA